MLHALRTRQPLIIEATSNQVDQYGGYTSMRPVDFRKMVCDMAIKVQLPLEQMILGGDHLGPNVWQHRPAEAAMKESEFLIHEYVKAGFRKIHLDCSMSCSDDPTPMNDETVAARAARLCAVAEKTWHKQGGEPPVYVVGTEVPVPGGAHESLDELQLTTVDAAAQTVEAHRRAFSELGLSAAWDRTIGLVVQPGVEFDNHKVVDFEPPKAEALSRFCESLPRLVYEAHSTDYQSGENLAALVTGHFAILKVGPGLTFAMREALWSLAQIEDEWIPEDERSHLKRIVLQAMEKNPKYWRAYYSDDKQQLLDFQYSLSDRIRYYWPVPEVDSALNKLIKNLDRSPPPETLISQFMPTQFQALRTGAIEQSARQLIFHKVSEVLSQYSSACDQSRKTC